MLRLHWPKSRSRKTLDAIVETALNTRIMSNRHNRLKDDYEGEETDQEIDRLLKENEGLKTELRAKNEFIQNLLFEMVMAKATTPAISPAMQAYLKKKENGADKAKLPG